MPNHYKYRVSFIFLLLAIFFLCCCFDPLPLAQQLVSELWVQIDFLKMVSNKVDIEPFDGKSNYTIWKSNIKDVLVQEGLFWTLDEKAKKPETMSEEDWEDKQMNACSTIRLNLTADVKYGVMNETSPSVLWKKLEMLYMSKSLTNRLYLKK